MSKDDKEWLKGTPFSKWIERLEILEKKVEERGDNYKIYNTYADMNERIEFLELGATARGQICTDNQEKIEKLEKTMKSAKALPTIVTHGEDHVRVDREISELKNNFPELLKALDFRLREELSELKEQQIHWATLENVTVCRLGIESLEEVLQGFQRIAETSIDFKTFSALSKTLKDKLGGQIK